MDCRDRSHFYALSSRLMRQILVDHARSRGRRKRGGAAPPIEFDETRMAPLAQPDLVRLDDALHALAETDARKCQVVELRFFGGLSAEETAEVLNVSPRTVLRDWRLAKVWLQREMEREAVDGADRWARVERIYHEAVDLPVGERARFLDSACAGDAALRRELESLLARTVRHCSKRSALDAAAMAIAQDAPPSWIGRTIRSYEILELLGAGGMGEVYRARDKTLGRDVALVPAYEMSGDAERLRRLEREARMLASLNDPRIATLFGLEEHDGQRFLVMELVPGQTLAERVRPGALAVRDALDICRQIAEGLRSRARRRHHHRDLKPANVKVLPDGRVKLLDFGLAKALETPAMGEPTRPGDSTREGSILGTPAYMSPEQARVRSWTAAPTSGRSAAASTKPCADARPSAARRRATRWSRSSTENPTGAPHEVARADLDELRGGFVVKRDAHERLQHIGDARLELEEKDAERNASPVRRPWRMRSVIAGATLLLVAGATLGVELWGPRMAAPPGAPVTRLTLKMEGETAGSLSLQVNGFSVLRAVARRCTSGDASESRQWIAALSPRALGFGRVASWHQDGDDSGVFSRRTLDRLLAARGTHAQESVDRRRPADRHRADGCGGFAIWAASDEIVIDTGGRPSQLWSVPPTEARLEPSPSAIDPGRRNRAARGCSRREGPARCQRASSGDLDRGALTRDRDEAPAVARRRQHYRPPHAYRPAGLLGCRHHLHRACGS
jgi:aminoglycoside phosphotransferase